MVENTLTPKHIEIAETFVRLYVFLTQYIDRCEDEAARKEYPEAELQKLMPDFKWADYLKELDIAAPGAINVGQPDFFKAANDVFKTVSLDNWKTYLRWHLIHATAPTLSQDFVDENFNFYAKTLTGAQKLKPRWKRVVSAVDNEIGEALGKLYVADYFPPEAKASALEMVNNLKEALAERIKTLEWMDAPTKKEALP